MIEKSRLDALEQSQSLSPSAAEPAAAASIPAIIEKFVIRLPNGLRTKIKELSENNRRSMNSEIIMVLEKHIKQSRSAEDISALTAELLDVDVTAEELKELELNKKLESLTADKKAALLNLLG